MSEVRRKLVVPGGSGFLGRIVASWFARRGWDVVVLARNPSKMIGPARAVGWDGRTPGDWAGELEGATAVLNLAGRSVNCRYHAANRRLIMDSRIDSTRVLGDAIARCNRPPPVWLNSSTATIYKHSFDQAMDEYGPIAGTPEAKDIFSVKVAEAWERAFEEAHVPRTRKVALRSAMVFGLGDGGVYAVLRRLVKARLGGAMGSGRQFVSWIHEHDFCRAVEWLIDRQGITGRVNLASPNPLPNQQMMQTLRKVLGVRFGLPASAWMLEVGAFLLRTETELIIKSRRVIPARLLAEGFVFDYPDLEAALAELETRRWSQAMPSPASL